MVSSVPLLPFDAYADALADASVVLRDNAARAGLDAPVPTCPGWSVRDLVAHLGMVHRWAGATVRDERVDADAIGRAAYDEPDLLDWLADGVADLLRTLDRAPDDLAAWFFLADPPPAKLAWARRQCHETTIHAVDAMLAATGQLPDGLWFGPRVAADGIDELLTGFLPRPKVAFRTPTPRRVVVRAGDDAWTVRLTPEDAATTRGEEPPADPVVRGNPVDLYLALWNRGGQVTETGVPLLEAWHAGMTVGW